MIASGRELMMMLPCASFSMRWCQSLKLRHPRLPATASATTPMSPSRMGEVLGHVAQFDRYDSSQRLRQMKQKSACI